MRIIFGIVLFFGCGEAYDLRSTEEEIKDSVSYYDKQLQGVWYSPGRSIREFEFNDGIVNQKGIKFSKYELISPQQLFIYGADTIAFHVNGDTLTINNVSYTRTP